MNTQRLYTLIQRPHQTEKTIRVGEENNVYGFQVLKNATKSEIKEAVETLFNVNVLGVSTLVVKGKRKVRMDRRVDKANDWKKAYVRISPGQNIDFVDFV